MNILSLKGAYVGQSGPKVVEAVQKAMGGCLFLDEAYSIIERGGDAFSIEVIRTLLTEIENNKGKLLVILAGYEEKMNALFQHPQCDGLSRRFGRRIALENYTGPEIALIAQGKSPLPLVLSPWHFFRRVLQPEHTPSPSVGHALAHST